jgi:prevent-host-death family protein
MVFKRQVTSTEARKNLSDLIGSAAYASERTVITRKGKPMAAIVSIEDLEAMEALEDHMDIQRAKESLEEARSGGGTVTLQQLEEEMQADREGEPAE